jgi:hypothetical protein
VIVAMAQLEPIETDLDCGYRKISVVGELDLAVSLSLRTNRERQETGKRFALVAPHGQVERVLGLTGLRENGLTFADVGSALVASP